MVAAAALSPLLWFFAPPSPPALQVEQPLPCHCRLQARSDDGGASWSAAVPVPALIEPVCAAGLLQVSPGALLFSNPATEGSRVNLTVRRSGDEGATWAAGAALVWPGPAAYSVLVPLAGQAASAPPDRSSSSSSSSDVASGRRSLTSGPVSAGVVFECGIKSPYETISFSSVTV